MKYWLLRVTRWAVIFPAQTIIKGQRGANAPAITAEKPEFEFFTLSTIGKAGPSGIGASHGIEGHCSWYSSLTSTNERGINALRMAPGQWS